MVRLRLRFLRQGEEEFLTHKFSFLRNFPPGHFPPGKYSDLKLTTSEPAEENGEEVKSGVPAVDILFQVSTKNKAQSQSPNRSHNTYLTWKYYP